MTINMRRGAMPSRSQRRAGFYLVVVTALVLPLAAYPPGVATAGGTRHPVSYNLPIAAAAELAQPGASPPGANDWSCHPSPALPRPVVLVHGLLVNMTSDWNTMSPLLANNGYCVFALTYGTTPGAAFPLDQIGGLVAMEQSAPQLAAFVDRVRASTGAGMVDLVGHSEGTVVSRYYLQRLGGAAKIAHLVALTPMYRGTDVDGLNQVRNVLNLFPVAATPIEGLVAQACGACQELLRDSSFMTALNAGGFTAAGVGYTNIVTRYDEEVTPFTSGIVPGASVTNFVLQDQCAIDLAEHNTVAFDAVAGRDMLNALDPGRYPAPGCTLVLPGIGSPFAPTS
jgi:triacylglycerol lipase